MRHALDGRRIAGGVDGIGRASGHVRVGDARRRRAQRCCSRRDPVVRRAEQVPAATERVRGERNHHLARYQQIGKVMRDVVGKRDRQQGRHEEPQELAGRSITH